MKNTLVYYVRLSCFERWNIQYYPKTKFPWLLWFLVVYAPEAVKTNTIPYHSFKDKKQQFGSYISIASCTIRFSTNHL